MYLHSHVWLFQGAEGGKWVQEIEQLHSTSQDQPGNSEIAASYEDADDRLRKRARTS